MRPPALTGLAPPVHQRLAVLFQLLCAWERAGLTGFRGEEALTRGYFGEALELQEFLPPGGPYLDVGSGGGTPALPLAAAGAGNWTLLEPRRTACTFLELAVRKLDLADRVRVERQRLGDWLAAAGPGPLPFAGVTLRAVRLTEREWRGLHAALAPGAVVVWPTSEAARGRAELPEGLFEERRQPATRGVIWLGGVSRET